MSTEDLNALSTDAVFHVLLDIKIPNTPTIYIVNNTENVTWNGNEYLQFPFKMQDLRFTSKSEVSQWTIKISNVNRVMENYIHQYDQYLKQNGISGNSIECEIRVVSSKDLANTTPIVFYKSILSQPTPDGQYMTFKLKSKNPYGKTFPPIVMHKNFCPWKFKSIECGYAGSGAFCDKVLTTCRTYNNSHRFGGFIGMGARSLLLVK